MAMRKDAYPANWKHISWEIRFLRAKGRCEQCGVKHGAIGARDCYGAWHDETEIDSMNSDRGYELFGDYPKMTKIILTVHHKGIDKPNGEKGNRSDKMDCRPENLIALCQKCHLAADRDLHIANAKRTRARKRKEKIAATGQKELL